GVRAFDYFSETGSTSPEHTTNPTAIFVPHPFTTYAANPDNVNHNTQGYRADKNKSYKADPDSINIVALGGSSTYGTRVYTKDSYPYLLEEILRRSVNTDKTINVINAGLGGYATPNIISLLSGKIVHLDPAIIIFYVGFNDAWTRLMFSDFKTDYSHAQKTWEDIDFPFWRHSRFLDLIAEKSGYPSVKPHIHSVAWKKTSGYPADNLRNSSADAFKANLMTLIGISRTHGAVPVLVTQATDFRNHPVPENNKEWIQAMEEHTRVIGQVADEMSVERIDVRSSMTDRKEYFLDVLHMNGNGNRKRAEIIADYLIQKKLIGKNIKGKELATLDLIIEYMGLQRADIFINRVLKYVISEMRKSGTEISIKDEEKMLAMFSSIKNVTAIYAPVYKHLSRQTLIEANKFFGSEAGKKSVSLYVSGNKSQKSSLTQDEAGKVQAFQSSASWKEIQKQRPYINRDAVKISGQVVNQYLSGELKLPEPGPRADE
ncbi:MAG: GDSL-type esterase/lipase family protein, partial [Thiogranum sp.]